MNSISAVITASTGIDGCPYIASFLEEADGKTLELIICDGSETFRDRSRPGLIHLSLQGRTIYGLITEGIKRATKDLIVLFEDHTRPMPGYLDAYRRAAENNPEIDLFSGGMDNLTTTSDWSFASFLVGVHDFWPQSRREPSYATTANLMVRRCAIIPDELTHEGSFVTETVQRLVRAGRYKYCPEALVDHVLHWNGRAAMAFQFSLTKGSTIMRRDSGATNRPLAVQLARDTLGFVQHMVVEPLRIMRDLRGTPQFRTAIWWRMAALGSAIGAGTLAADLELALGSIGMAKPRAPDARAQAHEL